MAGAGQNTGSHPRCHSLSLYYPVIPHYYLYIFAVFQISELHEVLYQYCS